MAYTTEEGCWEDAEAYAMRLLDTSGPEKAWLGDCGGFSMDHSIVFSWLFNLVDLHSCSGHFLFLFGTSRNVFFLHDMQGILMSCPL